RPDIHEVDLALAVVPVAVEVVVGHGLVHHGARGRLACDSRVADSEGTELVVECSLVDGLDGAVLRLGTLDRIVSLGEAALPARRDVGVVAGGGGGRAEVFDARSRGTRGEVDVRAAIEDRRVLPAEAELAERSRDARPQLAVEQARRVGLR